MVPNQKMIQQLQAKMMKIQEGYWATSKRSKPPSAAWSPWS